MPTAATHAWRPGAARAITLDGRAVLWLAAGRSGGTYPVTPTTGPRTGRRIARSVLRPVAALAAEAGG